MKVLFEDRAVKIDYNGITYLCIADLHLGFELDYLRKGVRYIENQSLNIIDDIITLLDRHNDIDILILLGDVKHTITRTTRYEKRLLNNLLKRIVNEKGIPILIIKGNHDGSLDSSIPDEYRTHVTIHSKVHLGDIALFHGHKKPDLDDLQLPYWITGHIHPSILIKDKFNNFIKRHVFLKLTLPIDNFNKVDNTSVEDKTSLLENHLKSKKILVLPSFNKYLAGYTLNIPSNNNIPALEKELGYIGTLIHKASNATEIYLTDGTYLTTLDKII